MDRELVSAEAVGTAIAVISGVGLLLAIAFGVMARGRAGLIRGALLAGCAALLFPLWLVYNRIEDALGLDSVAALLINLTLFIVVGIGAGIALRRFWPAEVEPAAE